MIAVILKDSYSATSTFAIIFHANYSVADYTSLGLVRTSQNSCTSQREMTGLCFIDDHCV